MSIPQIARAVWRWPPEPVAVLEVGLAVLLVAPVAGVATALATFVRDRERDYALITALLLAMLTVSFALTLGG